MKRELRKGCILFFLLTLMMVFGTALAFAEGADNYSAELYENGEDHILTIDGKVIDTNSVPPMIEDSRCLVPVRAVFEAIGAEVEWSEDNPDRVGISYNDIQVELTINNTVAYVNGDEKRLDVPARLVDNSRVVIPVRFVGEALTFGVGYDADERVVILTSPKTEESNPSSSGNGSSVGSASPGEDIIGYVTGMDFENLPDGHLITLYADEAMEDYESFILANPHRYVIDIKSFGLDMKNDTITIPSTEDNNVVNAIRAGQFSEDTVRIVVDLQQYANPSLFTKDSGKTITIEFRKLQPAPEEEQNGNNSNEDNLLYDEDGNPIYVKGSKMPATINDVVILIDPGHGGADPGAQGKSNGTVVLNEKDINFDVATRLNAKLQAAGIKTIMTRTTDSYVNPNSTNAKEDLYARADLANELGVSLVVSIHNNSVANAPNANGTETLYNDTDQKSQYGFSSKALAEIVQKKMISTVGTYSRGAKERPDLGLLRLTEMPAIIVEGAFLTNAGDLALMQTEAFRENYATAVAEGVVEYLNRVYDDLES